jgi:hypothetical protein
MSTVTRESFAEWKQTQMRRKHKKKAEVDAQCKPKDPQGQRTLEKSKA